MKKTNYYYQLKVATNYIFSHIRSEYHLCSFCRLVDASSEVLLGPSSSPEVGLYKEMARMWLEIDTTKMEALRRKAEDEELISFGVKYLEHTKDRGDYKELMSLSLLLLGAYPSDLPPCHVRPIGCVSHARWMCKLICEMKAVLYRSQFQDLGLFTAEEAESHVEYVRFLLKHYVRQWLESPSVADAPFNDLSLFYDLQAVKPSSPLHQFAEPMLHKLDCHLWYLSEELVPLVLFSDKLTEAQKVKCARAMRMHHKPGGESLRGGGKLTTPILQKSTKIWDLFGPNSWLILNLLSIGINDKSFIGKPIPQWKSDRDFCLLKNVVMNMSLTNDAAERGILLAKELQGKVSYDEEERKKLVLAIPELRNRLVSLKRDDLIHFYTNLP